MLPNTETTETVKSKTDSMSTFDPRHTSDRNHDVSRTLEHLRDLKILVHININTCEIYLTNKQNFNLNVFC